MATTSKSGLGPRSFKNAAIGHASLRTTVIEMDGERKCHTIEPKPNQPNLTHKKQEGKLHNDFSDQNEDQS
jgi:hypothetical protein